jgi:hypothetical protein
MESVVMIYIPDIIKIGLDIQKFMRWEYRAEKTKTR